MSSPQPIQRAGVVRAVASIVGMTTLASAHINASRAPGQSRQEPRWAATQTTQPRRSASRLNPRNAPPVLCTIAERRLAFSSSTG